MWVTSWRLFSELSGVSLVSHRFPGNVTCTPGFSSSLVVQVNGYSASSSWGIFCRFIFTWTTWTSLVYFISLLFHCCHPKCVLTKNSLLSYILSLFVLRWKCFHLQFEKHFLFLYSRFLLGVGLHSDHCRDAEQGQALLQHSQCHQTVTGSALVNKVLYCTAVKVLTVSGGSFDRSSELFGESLPIYQTITEHLNFSHNASVTCTRHSHDTKVAS